MSRQKRSYTKRSWLSHFKHPDQVVFYLYLSVGRAILSSNAPTSNLTTGYWPEVKDFVAQIYLARCLVSVDICLTLLFKPFET